MNEEGFSRPNLLGDRNRFRDTEMTGVGFWAQAVQHQEIRAAGQFDRFARDSFAIRVVGEALSGALLLEVES